LYSLSIIKKLYYNVFFSVILTKNRIEKQND
jgi:hypothetical protein